MRLSAAGLSLIQHFEGFSAIPYRCPAGYWTIGYGHVVSAADAAATVPIDQAQAIALLRADSAHAEQAMRQLISVPLNQQQFDALVSFTFNLGSGALQRSTLRRIVNRREHARVPTELLRWVWAGGRRLPGLIARRAAEGRLYGSEG